MANIILPQVAIKNQLSGGENFLIETNGEIQRVAADIVGTNIEVDTTLTQRGMAADAKATGDGIQAAVDSKVSKTGDTITGSLKLQGNLTDVNAIEFGGDTNHGGYIDFHYGKNTADYTSRLIEYEEGVLSVNEGNSVKLGNILLNNSSYGSTLPETATPGQLFFKKTTGTIADMDTNLVSELMLKAYPVGSIYMSANSTSPAFLFGGTWTRLSNTFLWGTDTDANIGKTGGESAHTLTVNEMPTHNHGSRYLAGTLANVMMDDGISMGASGIVSMSLARARSWQGASGSASYRVDINATHEHDYNGGGVAHNNMPPYLEVAMWKRTA